MLIAVALILLVLQISSGAWRSEFTGHPDEAAQFVTGRMIWEYLHAIPAQNPLQWAGQYYLHYPKVALGHWPPGYHIMEALWSFPFGSSRVSAMLLQWLIAILVLALVYSLARKVLGRAVTIGILLLTVAAPVFQAGLEETMSELSSLLCGVLFGYAVLRFLRKPGSQSICMMAAAFVAAASVKGTAIILLPVPFLAWWGYNGVRSVPIQWRLNWVTGVMISAFAGCGVWYLSTTRILYWGGVSTAMTWPILLLGSIAGWGVVALACGGVRREPLLIVSAAFVASAVTVSFFVRAMSEPRHWIVILPYLLILAGSAVTRVPRFVGILLLALALYSFPWKLLHWEERGYAGFAHSLKLPSRMLISSGRGALGEGGWIATICMAERFPASFVVRASKVLAYSGWNGEDYTLQFHSSSEVEARLDELAIEMVILDAPKAPSPAHHVLLRSMLAATSKWKKCRTGNDIQAYCRVRPVEAERKPLVIQADGFTLIEDLTTKK